MVPRKEFIASGRVLDGGATLDGNARANRNRVRSGAVIEGDAAFNTFAGAGQVLGTQTSPLALPLPISVPTMPDFTAGSQAVTVDKGRTLTLASGDYGAVKLKSNWPWAPAVLKLSGGVYNLGSLVRQQNVSDWDEGA